VRRWIRLGDTGLAYVGISVARHGDIHDRKKWDLDRGSTQESVQTNALGCRDPLKLDLSPKEFGLLEFLTRHAGHPVSRSTIVEQVWGLNVETMTNVVDEYVNYLRRKVDSGHDRPLIRTIRGTGYQIGANGFVS
jgi:DNA-binding response OmpR family regulator